MRCGSGDGPAEPAVVVCPDGGVTHAGDLFLRLARDGLLVLDADRADRLITGLERTIAQLDGQLCRVGLARRLSLDALLELVPSAEPGIVAAAFAELTAPGRFERAAAELAKYLAAFRIAKANAAGQGRGATSLATLKDRLKES